MINSVTPYLEDLVGYGVLLDALTVLLFLHVIGNTDFLQGGRRTNILITHNPSDLLQIIVDLKSIKTIQKLMRERLYFDF